MRRGAKIIVVFGLAVVLSLGFQACTKRGNPLTETINPVLPSGDVYSLEVAPSTVIVKQGAVSKFDVILVRRAGVPHRFVVTLENGAGTAPWWFTPFYMYVKDYAKRTVKIGALYSQVSSGTYTLKAEAVDGSSGGLSLEKEITIVKKEEHLVTPPVAVLTYSPATVYAGQDVVFDGSGSYDEDGYIKMFKWKVDGQWVKWGAGITSIVWNFSTSGYHTVVLEVVDNDGAYGTTAVVVDVQ